MKKLFNKKSIVIFLIIVTLFMITRYGLLTMIPGMFCDYIEYNGVKYYPVNDSSIVEELRPEGTLYSSMADDEDCTVKVKLYKNKGLRIGIFKRFYAENFYGFKPDEITLLVFDSGWYVNDYDLANRDPLEKWLD